MACGNAYCEATVEIADSGTPLCDVTDWSSTLSADLLSNHSDGRAYGQIACSFNHQAVIGFTTLNLAHGATADGLLIGSVVTAIELVADNFGAGTVTHRLAKARCITASAAGGHGRNAELQMAYEAIGDGGSEPTVTWSYSGT